MALDINTMLSQLTGQAQQLDAVNLQVQQNIAQDTAKMRNLLETNTAEATAAAEEAANIARGVAGVEYNRQKTVEKAQATLGLNPDDQNNELVRSMAIFNNAQAEREAVDKRYNELSNVDFWQNPVGYLFAQLQLPTVATRFNNLVDTQDAAAQNIQTRQALLSQNRAAVVANTADTLKDLNLRKADNDLTVAKIQVRQQEAENISKLGARDLEIYRLESDRTQNTRSLFGAVMQVESFRAQQENNRLAREERADRLREKAEAKELKAEEEADLNARLNAAGKMLGYQDGAINLKSIKLLDAKKRESIAAVAANGTLGSNFIGSIQTIQQAGVEQVMAQTNPAMARFVRNVNNGIKVFADQVETNAAKTGTKLKKGESITEGASDYEQAIISSTSSFKTKQALNSKNWDDTGVFNPYKPEYLVLLDAVDAKQINLPADNSAVTALRTLRGTLPQGASNLSGQDMERLVQTMAAQVASGKLGPDKAANDLVALHRAGAQLNLKLYDYTKFGLPVQENAVVKVPGLARFSDPQSVDLLNPASTKNAIVKMAAQSSAVTNLKNAIPTPQPFMPALGITAPFWKAVEQAATPKK